MLATLYFYDYNNYYNRIVKKEDTLADYAQYLMGYVSNTNFIPNDDVNTEQILNWDEESEMPNYMIVSYDNETIASRWFVIENSRLRNGQYKLILRRDLMADYYDTVINSDCFVEKAILADSDPLIYNKEDMTVNQIKIGETVLKDNTQSPWLVGYIARTDGEGNKKTYNGKVNFPPNIQDITIDSLANWGYKYFTDYTGHTARPFVINPFGSNSSLYYTSKSIGGYCADSGTHAYAFSSIEQGGEINTTVDNDTLAANYLGLSPAVGASWASPGDIATAFCVYFRNCLNDNYQNIQSDFQKLGISNEDYNEGIRKFYNTDDAFAIDFFNLNNKNIYVTNEAKLYKISVTKRAQTIIFNFNFRNNNTIFTKLKAFLDRARSRILLSDGENSTFTLSFQGYTESYILNLTEVALEDDTSISFTMNGARNSLKDAPYDMFCVPFSENFKVKNGSNYINTDPELNFNLVNYISEQYSGSGGGLYDLQLLPYCPFESLAFVDTDGKGCIDLSSLTSGSDYSFITGNNTNQSLGVIFYPNISSWSFNIPFSISISDKKLENQTKLYRLCSPNYNGVFEFNAAMNDGVDFVQIDCTYLPYSPYIHAAPNFKNLYGQLFYTDAKADSRGLVCKGDFSLTTTSDAWANYQNNNKNYENIFNRQIENMEVQNDVNRTREIVSAVTGTISGGAGLAAAGATVNPVAGAVGGIVGGIAGGVGGYYDYKLNERLRNEAIDYQKDNFGYQLGNIKARADSLSKTTAYTYNNRYFIFVEEYDCTDIEKQAFLNKIKFNGMTVMKIGKIADYLQNYYHDEPLRYFKGSLIRLTDIGNDFHILNAIAGEVYKGVFI